MAELDLVEAVVRHLINAFVGRHIILADVLLGIVNPFWNILLLVLILIVGALGAQQPLPEVMFRPGVLGQGAVPFEWTDGQFVDVDGDGLPDWVVSFYVSPQDNANRIWMNRGGTWTNGAEWKSAEELLEELVKGGQLREDDDEYFQMMSLLASGDRSLRYYATRFQDGAKFLRHARYHVKQRNACTC